ncbi:MAG TPA: hypothetical protein PLS49_07635 [Candidatus Woesebacteria bacterium]|nr:hypothetical protein [Candidatus Woesebacteria bacterium]
MSVIQQDINSVKDRLHILEEYLKIDTDEEYKLASFSATLADMKADIEFLKNTQAVASVEAHLAQNNITIEQSGEDTILNNLTITGKANLFELAVLKKITTGLLSIEGLSCPDSDHEQNCTSSISTLSGPLTLQPTAAGPLELMAGKIIIDTNGDMKIDGKLTVGEIQTERVVLGTDAVVTSGNTPPQNPCITGAMYVFNDKEKDETRMFVCSRKVWQELLQAKIDE